MAATSTITIAQTMDWAKRLNFNRESNFGEFVEPALTSANIVIQTILGPPFNWRWNIEEVNFTCTDPAAAWAANTALPLGFSFIDSNGNRQVVTSIGSVPHQSGGSQPTWKTPASATATTTDGDLTWTVDYVSDYTVSVPQMGFIEHASVQQINPAKWFEMENKISLSLDSAPARPRFISAHSEDGQGNVTFRFIPVPDKAYPIEIHIQKSAPLITSINDTWAPLPDYFQYIYSWGFLALMYMFADDPRFAVANQKFVAHLVGASEGLTETEKNIFLNNWNVITSGQAMIQNQGIQARAT